MYQVSDGSEFIFSKIVIHIHITFLLSRAKKTFLSITAEKKMSQYCQESEPRPLDFLQMLWTNANELSVVEKLYNLIIEDYLNNLYFIFNINSKALGGIALLHLWQPCTFNCKHKVISSILKLAILPFLAVVWYSSTYWEGSKECTLVDVSPGPQSMCVLWSSFKVRFPAIKY